MPIVVTGFEPLDILEGIRRTVHQLERGEAYLDNAYARAVPPEGNPAARNLLSDVFKVTDRGWRGIGIIPESGWRLVGRSTGISMPSTGSRSATSTPRSRRCAAAARCCRVSSSRTSAPRSARSVHAPQPARGDHGLQ